MVMFQPDGKAKKIASAILKKKGVRKPKSSGKDAKATKVMITPYLQH